MNEPGGVTPGELSRQVREVLVRLEGLIKQVEERYVRKDLLDLYKESINSTINSLQSSLQQSVNGVSSDLSDKADRNDMRALEKRVNELEDNNKWLFRLVIGFIILAVLGFVFANGGVK